MPFIPIDGDTAAAQPRSGFVPLDVAEHAIPSGFTPLEPEQPSVLRNVALNNPFTAVGETAINLATQGVALPVAGLAGIGAAAGRALGLTDREPADVVHAVGDALTYAPRGEFGKAATGIVMAPFEALAGVAGKAGTATLSATGSPVAATVVDTAIQSLPMAIAPAWNAGKATTARGLLNHHPNPSPEVIQRLLRIPENEAAAYFNDWSAKRAAREGERDASAISAVPGRVQRLDANPATVLELESMGLEALRRPGDQALPAPAGDLPEHLSASPLEAGDGRRAGAFATDEATRRPELADLRGADAEYRGLGAGSGDQAGDAASSAIPIRSRAGARVDAGQAESIARAERILTERGSIVGWIDHYNRHVNDGNTIDSFSRHADGSHTLRVSDGNTARSVSIPVADLPRYLDTLRDPGKVAEIEARNANDVVFGRKVREVDDLTLERWRGMGNVSDTARAKIEREARRREVANAAVTSAVTTETPVRRDVVSGAVSAESAPLAMRIDEAAHQAATSPLNDRPHPTPAQIEAGTYAKGHVDLHGLPISIENPKGSTRRGTDGSGRPWETTLENHYGYIKRTLAKDGDQIDVFIGERPESTRAFVIDQVDPKNGKYDEPKVILGALDEADARRIYHANYEPGWKGLGAITPMEIDAFKGWVKSSDTKKPVGLPRVAGKAVTEFDNAALTRLQTSPVLSETARGKVRAEIDRRAAAEATPVRAQLGEASGTQHMAAGVQNGTWNPGAQYTPFVDQVRAPTNNAKTVADLPAPIRREQIIGDFAKALGTTVYEGRVKGKNRLGFFRPKVEEVRIKRAADIEVAAHEVAHLIDHRVPELHQAWKADKDLAAELRSVSYDQKSVTEGFAEGMRLFLTQPETLEAKAPKVHAWLESFAREHEYGPALRTAQGRMTAWFGQDALNRARSKIGTEKPMAEFFDQFWDKFRQSTVDDLHGVYRMERDSTGKINPNGPYESARLSRGAASTADGAVRFGYPVKLPDGSFKFAGKGLEEIMKPLADKLDDALLYFVGRSSAELMGQGREHLFTKGEIEAMQRLRTPERDKAFAEYQEWNRGVLDFAEAQGIINPESRRLWQRTQYLPFHRVEQPGGLKGKPGDWSGVQALTGGTTNIKDVLGNMIGNAAMLIDKAVKNEARRKIANLSQQEGGGKFMVKIEPGERMVKIGGDQVLRALLEKYGIGLEGGAPAFFEFLIKGQPPGGNNVVAVLQGGKPIWFEVGDPILMRALQSIDRPVQSEVVKWLGLPKRVGQTTITATVDFWTANIARDTIMGSVMSRAGFRPILDSLDGMHMRMTKDPIYREWVANGGGLSSIYLDEAKLRTNLERFYGRQGIDYRTVVDAPDKLLTMIETLGDAFESSTRLGEYKRARQRGENPRHAAYLAREVSTDFAMKGDSKALGFMYDTVMFLRPAVVSWDRLYRGLAHDPNKGAIAAKAGTLALASAALYLLNRDDPRYADLPDWDRDANWHFFVGEHHFRWPKIWEIGAMASAAERSVEKIMAEDPAGLGKDFARILGHTFSVNWMPQIMAPLADQAANRNAFTKAPIETPGMENLQPFMRAKPGTSETMKAAGMATRDLPESLQVNPARAEALLRGYFNTYALYGLMLTDQAFFGDKLPEKRADELPVVRRFYANEPAKHTTHESAFYDLLQESKRLRGTMRELDDMNLRGLADEKERSPLAGEAKPLERAAKNLSGINNEMQAVRRDDALTPAEKRQRLDGLTVERNALLKAAVIDSKAAQKEKQQ